jgi:hypothetical protein
MSLRPFQRPFSSHARVYPSQDRSFLIDICVASMIALMLGFVAHYVFGFSRLDIRALALMGAGIFGAVVVTEWFAQLRKSN